MTVVKPVEPRKPICDSTFVYTVKAGDSFNGIAYKHHVTPQQLQKANPDIKNPGVLSEGQKITVNSYKVSTWNAYESAQEKYSKDVSDYFEYQKEQKQREAKKQTSAQTETQTCPKFMDDPVAWVKYRLLYY